MTASTETLAAAQMLETMWDADMGVARRARPSAVAESASQRTLRAFVDTFVTQEFLPHVFITFRCGERMGTRNLTIRSQLLRI